MTDQVPGQCPATGSDLQYLVIGPRAESVDDLALQIRVDEEVLP